MNSNKLTADLNTNEEKIIRDSFGNRILYNGNSDDLCEEVLKWLPFEDKLKLRGVSKQFNRCLCNVAKRQKVLVAIFKIDLDYKTPYQISHREFYIRRIESTKVWIKQLIHVLKTFKNIDNISIKVIDVITYPQQFMEAIIDNCRQLKSIRFDFKDIDPLVINKFGLKFGNTLEYVYFNGYNFEPKVLKMCHQIIAINSFRVDCSLWLNEDISMKKLKKLYRLWIDRNCKRSSFDLFISECPELTHLTISFDIRNISFEYMISKLHELKNLKNLSISLWGNLSKSLASNLKVIAKNCNHLKAFAFDFSFEKFLTANEFYEHFKHFSTLTELSLSLGSKLISRIELNFLEKCRKLTHLVMKLSIIDENTFRGIQRIVPHLQYLTLGVSTQLSGETLELISELKCLRQLIIKENMGDIGFRFNPLLKSRTDSAIISLIKNCNNLQTFKIEYRIEIGIIPFIHLIEKSEENPNIFFEYELLPNSRLDLDQLILSSPYPMDNIVINGETKKERMAKYSAKGITTSIDYTLPVQKCKFYL